METVLYVKTVSLEMAWSVVNARNVGTALYVRTAGQETICSAKNANSAVAVLSARIVR